MSAAEQFHIEEVSPSYWRVVFDNGRVNLLDPDTVDQLGALVTRVEDTPNLTVVVFRSEKPGYRHRYAHDPDNERRLQELSLTAAS
jgi:enoyl-CoA hydratase/carnithine racemase